MICKKALFPMFCVGLLVSAPGVAEEAKTQASNAPPAPATATTDPLAAVPSASPADVESIDAIVKTLYAVISGDAGVKRDWDRFRSLFYPDARMIPTGVNAETKKVVARVSMLDTYIERSSPFMEKNGFHEAEIARRVEQYGNIAHVFSTYTSRYKLTDPKPFARGINSIQLLNDGTRWWILSVAWSSETPEHPIPPQYLVTP